MLYIYTSSFITLAAGLLISRRTEIIHIGLNDQKVAAAAAAAL